MHKLFLIFCLFLFITEVSSQDSSMVKKENTIKYDEESKQNPVIFNKEEIDNLKQDDTLNYNQEAKEDTWFDAVKKWLSELWHRFWDWLIGDYQATGFLASIIKLIPYIIIAGILAFVVWLFFRLNPGASFLKSAESPSVFFTEEEEIIKSKDIQKLIKKALDEQNYRLAVRYYYLLILKNLVEKNIIRYEFDKTNTDYIKEIKQEAIHINFKKATLIYDYIWYGNFEVTHIDFKKAQHTFINLEHQIMKTVE